MGQHASLPRSKPSDSIWRRTSAGWTSLDQPELGDSVLAIESTSSENPSTEVILNQVDDDRIERRRSRFPLCKAPKLADNTHWILTGFFLLALIPAFRAAHLPIAVNWQRLLSAYWGGLAARAIFCAVLLWVIGLPLESTLKPLYARYM